ncbi:MAG TPA: glycine zipper family protein [Polyangiaceae bacterium]|nr:glycine zipper family protein [Polyangiaceae bacterium]
MAEVFMLALSFPSVVYTVLLGVVLIYWTFVMVGVIHIGEGSEGALEGHIDGATKGMLEGAVDHLGGGHADVGDIGGGDGGDLDIGDGDDASSGSHGALAALMSALHLRSVPATVVFSLIITFSWLMSVVSMQLFTRMAPALHGLGLSLGVLAASFVLALPLTSIAARPLATVFAPKHAPVKSDFIGRTCVVRTGTVTNKFGEATLHDGGAGLVLRVRIEDGKQLARGEQALIVDYDAERETYLVEPMRDVMEEKK